MGVAAETASATTSATAKGVVKAVRPIFRQLYVTVNKNTDIFRVTTKATVTLHGKVSSLTSLKAGEQVTVTYTVSGNRWNASLVAVK